MAGSRSERFSANEIYAAVRKENSYLQEIEPVDAITLNFDLSSDQLDKDIDSLAKHIQQLREQDFDGYYIDKNGARVLVKYHNEEKNKDTYKLDPIHVHEADVQANRYLRAMLLIVKHLKDEETKLALLKSIKEKYQGYEESKKQGHDPADLTLKLADDFTHALAEALAVGYDKAAKQLTMARDLGILLEDHPSVCTVSEEKDSVTIEISTPYKVRKSYYEDPELFGENPQQDIPEQPWFKSAKNLAGYDVEENDTWMENFFANNWEAIKERGVAVPPSARWLPIPANNQRVDIEVAERKEKSSDMKFSHTHFMRTGVAIAYDVRRIPGVTLPETEERAPHEKLIDKVVRLFKRPDEEQKKIAKKILRELILSQLDTQIEEYKALYGGVIGRNEFNFYFNYQTLLSPLIGERRFGHVDNNARFVALVKEVVSELDNDKELKQEYKEKFGANLKIRHTNSAVNRNAYLSNEWSEDDQVRREKIAELAQIKRLMFADKFIPPNISPDAVRFSEYRQPMLDLGFSETLVNELIQREQACESLQLLLDGKPPYDGLRRYQRNIMMAALEHLVLGSQTYSIVGCKSARDRTGVFACAVKVMKENPAAMRDWKVLEKGIVKSLKQGHAFRSMIFHSAIVKVSLVHNRFMKKLRPVTQKQIKDLLVFSRKLDKYENEKIRLVREQSQPVIPRERSTVQASAPLSKNDARYLLIAGRDKELKPKIEEGKRIWVEMMDKFAGELPKQDLTSMDQYLENLRTAHLNTKSTIVYPRSNRDLKVRIYPHQPANVNTSVHDFFAAGIDSARGALMILQHSPLDEDVKERLLHQIKKTLVIFQQTIAALEKMKSLTDAEKVAQLQQAQKEYSKLNGVLSSLLAQAGCYPDHDAAARGIVEARDLLWILSRKDEAVCTLRHDKDGKIAALSFARRMNFPGEDLDDYAQQPWFQQFHGAHPWAASFFATHPEVLDLSSTPMQRSLPNPANAWEEATILVEDSEKAIVGQIIRGVRMGISSPYQVKEKEERQRLTTRNHLQMFPDARLQEYAERHMEMWKGLHPGNDIAIPILHQTLVDPGALRYIACRTGGNPRDMIKRKQLANRELREYLQNKKIYYDKITGQVVMDPQTVTDNLVKINFVLKETNNGINVHEKMTDKSTQDYLDARDLIYMAKDKLQILHLHLKNSPSGAAERWTDFDMVMHYLSSSTPDKHRKMTNDESEALSRICENLLKGTYAEFVEPSVQKNLALLLQAAANLTSFLSPDIGTNFVAYVSDGTARMNPLSKPADISDATYKACYERILAELLGVRMGGCKSALDREQEVAELTNAMYRQFQAEGRIVNYHDPLEEKQRFLEGYVDTQHKHNMCEMITGNPGSSDFETQGLAYHQESAFEQKASSLLERGCRHPKAPDISYEQYIKESKKKIGHVPHFLRAVFNKPKSRSAADAPKIDPHNPRDYQH